MTRSLRSLHYAAFIAGLAAVCWIGAGYAGTNPLALAVTVIIGAFYAAGALELHRFRQATSTLERAVADLCAPPASLHQWIDTVHPSLRNAVRLRVEGERVGMPGPALTPYLVGMLVLLGMLGTFVGMVVTLSGTGLALDSAADLQAVRKSLSAPVRGLGVAFGTSVAGVAASAMLGLMSALSRRERLQAAQLLDTRIATVLRPFSLAHQREESFKLMQRQTELMPALVDRLQAMMDAMGRQTQALNERLLASQEHFHGKAEAAYAGLALSIDRSLKESLTESARTAGATIQPVVEATMAGIAQQAAALHETVARLSQQQLDDISARLEATTTTVTNTCKAAIAEQRQMNEALSHDLRASFNGFAGTFEQRSESLVRAVDQAHVQLREQTAAQDQQRLAAWSGELQGMAASLQQQWQQAGALAAAQQQQMCETLAKTAGDVATHAETQAKSTIAEVARLVHAVAEAPRTAAEVMAQMRQQLSDSLARDNAMLDERSRILETLAQLLDHVNHASNEQRAAIDALVAGSADLLDRVGRRFTEKLDAHTEKMTTAAAEVTGSAAEVASLGEAFGLAVRLFSEANDKLVAHLQRIEGALSKSITRSDEQLAYYVAQAREVIDLSIMSQKQIVDDLQQLAGRRELVASEA